MASTIDCGDRICTMDYRFTQNCVLYVDISEEKTCQYPCSFLNCQSEVHRLVLCPVWACTSKTTTPAPDISTLSPLPPLPTVGWSSSVCIPSLVFNGIFGTIFLALLMLLFLRRRRYQALANLTNFYGEVNPLFVESQGPIIRNVERIPLLARRASNQSNQPQGPLLNPSLNLNQSQARETAVNLPNFYEQIHAAVLPTVQETAF